MCMARWVKIGERWITLMELKEEICVQEVYPKIGKLFSYPYEAWMDKLPKTTPRPKAA
jgi:hypothetical protein